MSMESPGFSPEQEFHVQEMLRNARQGESDRIRAKQLEAVSRLENAARWYANHYDPIMAAGLRDTLRLITDAYRQ